MRDGRVLLGRRSNTGYGDGAYEPPSSRLDERETVVEAAIRVAAAQAGIALGASHVTLAHVMHDVSGAGRIAFFLTADGWEGEPGGACASYSDLAWFAADDLPANMIDRARVAVRNYAAGIGFSTYPAFLPGGINTNPPRPPFLVQPPSVESARREDPTKPPGPSDGSPDRSKLHSQAHSASRATVRRLACLRPKRARFPVPDTPFPSGRCVTNARRSHEGFVTWEGFLRPWP